MDSKTKNDFPLERTEVERKAVFDAILKRERDPAHVRNLSAIHDLDEFIGKANKRAEDSTKFDDDENSDSVSEIELSYEVEELEKLRRKIRGDLADTAPPEPQTAPAQTATTPATVVTVGALMEPAKAGPVVDGLLTKEIAAIFDGLNGWDAERWTKNLSSSKWLHSARTALGGAGVASSVWNPLTLAQKIHGKTKGDKAKEQLMKALKSRFTRNPVLMPWREAFDEYYATHCTTD